MGSSRETAPPPHRPPPLRIHRDSHAIQKPASTSTSSSSSASNSSSSTSPSSSAAQSTQHRQPVIIYTHSPRVIRTNPDNFMALVQKLTGMNSNDAPKECTPTSTGKTTQPVKPRQEAAAVRPRPVPIRHFPCSSPSPGENAGLVGGIPLPTAPMPLPAFNMPFFPDIPLFTPMPAADLFYPQRHLYMGGDAMLQ